MGMEPQSTLSGFSVQTNRASCVFVGHKTFCRTKTNLPFLMVGDFSSKVGKIGTIKYYLNKNSVNQYTTVFILFVY